MCQFVDGTLSPIVILLCYVKNECGNIIISKVKVGLLVSEKGQICRIHGILGI